VPRTKSSKESSDIEGKSRTLKIQGVSIMNLIQIKRLKVIDNLKNMTIQGFQHGVESELIEVMKMKMLSIQFASIVKGYESESEEKNGSYDGCSD
jgi:hypothetical protein